MNQLAMVFGVFDTFHKGHEYFLTQAKSRCDNLIVVVTLSEVVALMKKRQPQHTLAERMEQVKNFCPDSTVIPGDSIMGEWNVFKTHTPDIIFLGYDQQGIAGELDRLGMKYEYIDSFQPEKYKSSFLFLRTQP